MGRGRGGSLPHAIGSSGLEKEKNIEGVTVTLGIRASATKHRALPKVRF